MQNDHVRHVGVIAEGLGSRGEGEFYGVLGSEESCRGVGQRVRGVRRVH